VCTATIEAHEETWKASKALALTAIDLYFRPEVLASVKQKFAELQQQ
jgi:hypothetical protein